jgi:hypothetical protein
VTVEREHRIIEDALADDVAVRVAVEVIKPLRVILSGYAPTNSAKGRRRRAQMLPAILA